MNCKQVAHPYREYPAYLGHQNCDRLAALENQFAERAGDNQVMTASA